MGASLVVALRVRPMADPAMWGGRSRAGRRSITASTWIAPLLDWRSTGFSVDASTRDRARRFPAGAGRPSTPGRGQLVKVRRLRGRPVSGHRRPVHHPLVSRAVPWPAPVQHASVVPHDEIADLPAMRVHAIWRRSQLEEL